MTVIPMRRPAASAPAPTPAAKLAAVIALPGAATEPVIQPATPSTRTFAQRRNSRDGHHPDCPITTDRRPPERCPVCRSMTVGAPGDGIRRDQQETETRTA